MTFLRMRNSRSSTLKRGVWKVISMHPSRLLEANAKTGEGGSRNKGECGTGQGQGCCGRQLTLRHWRPRQRLWRRRQEFLFVLEGDLPVMTVTAQGRAPMHPHPRREKMPLTGLLVYLTRLPFAECPPDGYGEEPAEAFPRTAIPAERQPESAWKTSRPVL